MINFKTSDRLIGLDALRGIAVLMVFAHHVYTNALGAGFWPWPTAHTVSTVFHGLRVGVELFFVLSGYVICLSLERSESAASFLKRRALRIYPAFLVLHVAVFAVGPIAGYRFLADVTAVQWAGLFTANALLLPGIFDVPIAQIVAWSLSYEAAFYLIATATFMGRTSSVAKGLIVLLAITVVAMYPRALFFVVGVLLWRLQGTRTQMRGSLLSGIIALGLSIWLWGKGGLTTILGPEPVWQLTLDNGIKVLVLSALSAVVLMAARGMSDSLSHVPAMLGRISYSFYLWHSALMWAWLVAVPADSQNMIVFTGVTLVGSIAVSWASWKWVEQRYYAR